MKQRGLTHRWIKVRDARRPRANQFRILAQQPLERGPSPVDHRFHSRFEFRDWGILLSGRLGLFHKPRPVLEVVPTSHGELGIGEIERDA